MALKRILKEVNDLENNPPLLFSARPMHHGDPLNWEVIVVGPYDSPYADGLFILEMTLPVDYPFKPPRVRFSTRIYHPNINSENGSISINILHEGWSPALTIASVVESIIMMMENPNPDDPLEPEIASLYILDRKKFEETAREWTKKFAT